jgi:hypothetical protein
LFLLKSFLKVVLAEHDNNYIAFKTLVPESLFDLHCSKSVMYFGLLNYSINFQNKFAELPSLLNENINHLQMKSLQILKHLRMLLIPC